MPKPIKLVANSTSTLSAVIGALRKAFGDGTYLRITIATGRDRSADQNALSHAWYSQIAQERGEMTRHGVKCFCKLHFGVGILKEQSEAFTADYDAAIKPLKYELKLKAIALMDVTSEMTTKSMSAYMEAIHEHFTGLPTDPVALEWPNDEKL